MKRNRSNKAKKSFLNDKEKESLMLIFFYGILVWIAVLCIIEALKGNKEAIKAVVAGIGVFVWSIIQNFVSSQKPKDIRDNNPDIGIDPSPIKPKPFTPQSSGDATEKVLVSNAKPIEGNYVAMARDLGERQLRANVEPQIVLPSYVPIQVSSLVNGNKQLALRLYEGEAKRNLGKNEQWLWEKVIEDLIRDRR